MPDLADATRDGDAVEVGEVAAPGPPGFAVSIFGTFVLAQGLGILAPMLPDLATQLSLTNSQAALLVSSVAFGRLVFSFPGGRLADRYGLRPVAFGSSIVVSLCASTCAAAPRYPILLGALLLAGMGTAAYTTAAMSSILRYSDQAGAGRVLARFQGSIVLGLSVSPLIGGVLVDLTGISGPFWYYAAASLIGGVASAVFLPSGATAHAGGEDARGGESDERRLRQVLRDRRFVLSAVAGFATLWSVGGVRNTLVPLFAGTDLGLRPAVVGLVLGIAALMNVVALVPGSRIADVAGRRPSMRIGMAWLTATTAMLLLVRDPVGLGVAVALGGFAKGLISVAPLAVVADIVDERLRGAAVGVSRTAAELGLAVGPITTGLVSDAAGPRGAFVASTAFLAVLTVLVFRMPETLGGDRASVRSALGRSERRRRVGRRRDRSA